MSEYILDQGLDTSKTRYNTRPNKERAKQIVIVLIISLIIALASIVSSYLQILLLEDLNTGIVISDSVADANDNREIALAITQFIMIIVGAIFFIRWFRRAYYNMGLRTTTEHTEGWAAGAWFIPILNLFRPYQIMSEMWKFTSSQLEIGGSNVNKAHSIVGVWWFLWLINSFTGTVASRIGDEYTIDGLLLASKGMIFSLVVGFPLALAAIYMIRSYDEMEQELNEVDFKVDQETDLIDDLTL